MPSRLEPGALDISLGCGDRAFRFSHLGVLRRFLGLEVFDGGLGAKTIRLGLRHPRSIVVILDLNEQLVLLDPLKIIHEHPTHVTLDLCAERRDVAANIGVIRNLADRQADPAVPLGRKQDNNDPCDKQDRQSERLGPNQARRRTRGTSVDPAECAGADGAKEVSRPVGNDCSTMLVLSSARTAGTFAQGAKKADTSATSIRQRR